MRCSNILPVMIVGLMCTGSPLAAQESGGRYKMSPVDDGFVRLDTETGAMSLCIRKGGGWACKPMDDSKPPGNDDLARLAKENAELKDEMRRMEETFGLDSRSKSGSEQNEDEQAKAKPEIQLPSEEQVDQAVDYLERMIRKFRERFEKFGDKTRPRGGQPKNDEDQESTPL